MPLQTMVAGKAARERKGKKLTPCLPCRLRSRKRPHGGAAVAGGKTSLIGRARQRVST
jgi:hypothetical protein